MADGHLGKCKECAKRDVRENRRKRVEYYRAYDRARGCRLTTEDVRRYRQQNPEKARAHNAVNNAIRDGKLERQPCEVCGTKKSVHAHHDDYAKPFDVRWLCAVHHSEHHRMTA